MNIKQAKKIDIATYLQNSGSQGEQKGAFIWFLSPLRDERTASFSVDPYKNKWIDFGSCQSGDIIDLFRLLFNTDTAGALEKLSECKPENFTPHSLIIPPANEKEPGILLNRIRPIQSKALIDYLKLRKIPLSIGMMYAREVFYTVKDRQYFSIAFKNDKGGYELRNQNFKNCIAPKYYTLIPVPGSNVLNLFEGFLNLLSSLVYYNLDALHENTIVLNSVSNLQSVIPLLPGYHKINSYLDNDQAGRDALEQVRNWNPNIKNKSKIIYEDYKDFNEFLCKR